MQKKERHFLFNIFLLCSAIFLITSLVLGYDFSTNNPSNLGHTANEVNVKINNMDYNLNTVINNINNTKIICGWDGWDRTDCLNCYTTSCELNVNRFRCSNGKLEKETCCMKCVPVY